MSIASDGASGRAAAAPGAITIEQLIALNDEIVALVRAGVPLERGLVGLGRDLRGRLGLVSRLLGARLAQGESLPQAIAADGAYYPPIYRAVVEAGMKAGRLPVALEGLGRIARNYAETRRAIGLALFYPLLVLMLAYVLFLGFILLLAPQFMTAFGSFQLAPNAAVRWISGLGRYVVYWGPVVPVVVFTLLAWWLAAGRAGALQPGWSGRFVGMIPWMRKLVAATEAANFSDLLALLLEHQVPVPSAVRLAANASCDSAMRRSAEELAVASEQGRTLADAVRAPSTLPPMLRWLIAGGSKQGMLVPALRHAGETYRRRALNQAEMIRVLLPTFLMLGVGATATLVFGLALFVPFGSLLYTLGVN